MTIVSLNGVVKSALVMPEQTHCFAFEHEKGEYEHPAVEQFGIEQSVISDLKDYYDLVEVTRIPETGLVVLTVNDLNAKSSIPFQVVAGIFAHKFKARDIPRTEIFQGVTVNRIHVFQYSYQSKSQYEYI